MIRLSIQARQALARLTLPVLIVVSFGIMLLGKADTLLADRARTALSDALAPIYAVVAAPLGRIHAAITETADLWDLRAENDRLRAENDKLRRWQSIALALDSENQRLKASLRWIPDPTASFVTARVVADAGGVYAKAVLLSVGPNSGIHKGEIAVDERGLVGRITEVGARTARVLLITDLNSRIPVTLETSRAHAILAGTNGNRPRLLYWPEGVVPKEGERIVTSAEANAFPANLPVGTVHYTSSGSAEVEPAAMLQKLEVVRIFDYGLTGVVAPERPASDPSASNPSPSGPSPSSLSTAGRH
jgi:rod shape-determining protein MreC